MCCLMNVWQPMQFIHIDTCVCPSCVPSAYHSILFEMGAGKPKRGKRPKSAPPPRKPKAEASGDVICIFGMLDRFAPDDPIYFQYRDDEEGTVSRSLMNKNKQLLMHLKAVNENFLSSGRP